MAYGVVGVMGWEIVQASVPKPPTFVIFRIFMKLYTISQANNIIMRPMSDEVIVFVARCIIPGFAPANMYMIPPMASSAGITNQITTAIIK